MHIHLPWLILAVTVICCIILLLVIPTEQQRLERTDLREEYRKRNNIK